jgi:RNA polymerase sigma factor (sigma-70 family)
MYGRKASVEVGRDEFDAARLGFRQLLRRKRFSPQFIGRHADDLFATATLELSRKLAEGDEIDNPAGWLITCAWRRTKSHLEAEARRPQSISTETTGPLADDRHQSPEDFVLDEDRVRKVREAVEQLPVEQRRVLALSYFEENTVREVGRHLRWHPSKAQRAHESAKRRLHELLGVESSDDLEVEVGLAGFLSVAEVSTRGGASGAFERAGEKTAEALAALKHHATNAYYRAVDPTPLAGARPGTIAGVVAGCIAFGGGAATYCVEQDVNPVGAARSLLASTDEPVEQAPSEAEPEPSPAPVYTPLEPAETEEAPVPPPTPTVEKVPEPKPEPEPPPPEDSFEPVSPAYASSEGGSEETYEAPEAAPVESTQSAPAPAQPGPQFGGHDATRSTPRSPPRPRLGARRRDRRRRRARGTPSGERWGIHDLRLSGRRGRIRQFGLRELCHPRDEVEAGVRSTRRGASRARHRERRS